MRQFVISSAIISVLWLGTGTRASADTIDFETQAANTGSFLTGIPDSPLAIGIATFTGGELRQAVAGLRADQTGVYATEGLFGGDSNPLTITFSSPIDGFSILVANGDAQNQGYTVADDIGGAVMKQLALSGAVSGSTAAFALPGNDITSVTISSSNSNFWNFAIDNVTFTAAAVPEPATFAPVGAALLIFLACIRCK